MKSIKPFLLTLLLAAALPALAADKKEETIKLKKAPEAVQAAIKKAAGNDKVKQVDKITDGDKVTYEATIARPGKDIEIEFSADGKIILTDEAVKLEDCPAPVQATIKAQVGNGKINLIEKVLKDGVTYYEAEITKDGKDLEIFIALDGKVMETKAATPEKPAAPAKK